MKMLYSAFQDKTINHINSMIVNPLIDKDSCGNQSIVSLVNEKYIDSAIEIADYFNITFEPSGISGLAMFLQMAEKKKMKINSHDKIIIISTGKSVTADYY